ncbi:protein SOGA1-like [Arapaima gigas]
MCKKLTKTAKESEGMREELAKYRSLYGDVDVPLTAQVSASHPYAYNPETKVHLRLLEEEANLLSRRIIELEVENSGLQAEMEELKEQEAGPRLGPGVDSMKELKRHLQFMEEEADLLRCSLVELEEQNRALKRSLGQFRTELESGEASQEDLAEGGTLWRIQHGSLPSHTDNNHPPFDGPAGSTQELLAGQGMKAQRNCTSLKRKDRDTQLAETEEVRGPTFVSSHAGIWLTEKPQAKDLTLKDQRKGSIEG